MGSRPKLSGTADEFRAGYDNLGEMLRAQEHGRPDTTVDVRDEAIYGGLTRPRWRIHGRSPRHILRRWPLSLHCPSCAVHARVGGLPTSPGVLGADAALRLPRRFQLGLRAPSARIGAVTDAYDLQAWGNAQKLGGSKDNMLAIGTFCGGGMALDVALKYLEYGMGDRARGVVALAPLTIHPEHVPENHKAHLKAWEENRDGPVPINGVSLSRSTTSSIDCRRHTLRRAAQLQFTMMGPSSRLRWTTHGGMQLSDLETKGGVPTQRSRVPYKLDNYEGLPHFFVSIPRSAKETASAEMLPPL
ncbi:Versiconal hemiacetal acetate esterase [Tolypocladium capitatum]|uniref:Versiconal hemiacetal acetate esterase n=1 Tax=Tolypocladium capitatum TaxID=45235 RepID=A0A2K3Q934_9HYPO|nr:Versiconal hemiacetal acetate esterase [Tolypocladium capitatum]